VSSPSGRRRRISLKRFAALAPDVGVVVAYGHLLKPELLAIPKRGMVNVHPSLLPSYAARPRSNGRSCAGSRTPASPSCR